MTHSVLLQPAYVLHTRAYRDTSLLLELFTPEHGRVSAIARSARGPRSRFKGLLQAFSPLVVSWYGKTELMSLSVAENNGVSHNLSGEALLCGMYLNELLVRLLHRYDAHPKLYQAYQTALLNLQQNHFTQPSLRLFEKCLLLELGYALQLDREAHTETPITPEQFYYFDPAQGFLPSISNTHTQSHIFSGQSLLALHKDELTEEIFLRDAKRLLRMALGRLLENKPIKSRELFLK
jgi:DNA repair protein RecO (recombination protein O)